MLIQGLFFLFFGVGIVLVALQGKQRGWLPNGPNGYKQGKGVSKDEQPVAFWFMFSLYFGGGVALVIYALRMLTGDVEPLPMH